MKEENVDISIYDLNSLETRQSMLSMPVWRLLHVFVFSEDKLCSGHPGYYYIYLYLYFVFSEDQLCSGQSGDYHCKAATFTHEETSTHTLTVFGENILYVAILYLTRT